METFKKKCIKVGDSLMVTIPADYVTFSGIKEGDLIEVKYKKIQNEKS